MLATLFLLAAATQVEPRPSPEPDFSRSYAVWIAYNEGRCTFFMTDAGEDAKQLRDTLRRNYAATAGIEILTDHETPSRCVAKARKAVTNAGFKHFRVRLGTDADRAAGIP
jgi:hypothetical protein